ncbi:MAG TPA: phosphatase PAP2 family protein [Devosia sp.]|nr:phosphatase PAP2 family protein [Devosia sp.]
MDDLSSTWPAGLGGRRWWLAAGGAIALLLVLLPFDRALSLWAQGWPPAIREPLAAVTRYGESDWILYPAAALFVVTVPLALLSPWRLMRLMLWQFAGLYAFIFLAVGVPNLFTLIVKRIIGRGRPEHFEQTGLLGLRPNWLDWSYQSFPSNHTTTAVALAVAIGFLAFRWFPIGVVFAIAIGVSRLSLGVHYPTDVVAGAMVGTVGAYAVRWGFARRGWVFREAPAGHIVVRPMSSMQRYLSLMRRRIGPGRRPDRP